MMLASLKVKSEASITNLPVVCEFPDVFADDIDDSPLECEEEFAIDLVHGIRHICMVLVTPQNLINLVNQFLCFI